jgi:tight adherence protein C
MQLIVAALFTASFYLLFRQLDFFRLQSEKAHLPLEVLKEDPLKEALLKKDVVFNILPKSWLPLSNKFKSYEQRINARNLKRRLIKAGSPLGVLEFIAFKIIFLILLPVVAYILLGDFFAKDLAVLILISLFLGFILPDLWLRRRIQRRQYHINRDLPNIIDLLNLCVSGGLDFMLAVNKVVRELKLCDITVELAEVYRQTQMGKTRREALKDLAWRVDTAEVYSFVRTLVQADRMGTPMAEALKMLAEDMRVRRFQRGEAMALKAPIKLLFPLFAFILPVVLIIVGAPVMLEFLRGSPTMKGF